jgi:hypothetical protein
LFDVIIRVESPQTPDPSGVPVNAMQQPDTVAITSARCRNGTLTVKAETSNKNADLTIAIEGLITEESFTAMTPIAGKPGKFIYTQAATCSTLRNKVVTVSSDGGFDPPFAPPAMWGSGGNYNARIST